MSALSSDSTLLMPAPALCVSAKAVPKQIKLHWQPVIKFSVGVNKP